MAIILAIGAAIGWGTADFFGGVSRRDASVFVIIAVSELAGVIVLIPIVIARGTPLPDGRSMLLACLAGLAVTVELGLIYAALSRGKAFITAPVGGLGTAVAATVGLLEGDRLDLMIALGLLCALIGSGVSAWTTSPDNQPRRIANDAAICAGAAACVGTMLICLHAAGRVNPYWATLAEHTSTALSAGLIAVAGHRGTHYAGSYPIVDSYRHWDSSLCRRRGRPGLRRRLPTRSAEHRLCALLAIPRHHRCARYRHPRPPTRPHADHRDHTRSPRSRPARSRDH